MPFALEVIRKFGRAGFNVCAADTFATAPGNHSRHVQGAWVSPAPRANPAVYVEALLARIREDRIDRLFPTFEEVFYLARRRPLFGEFTEVFCADFETLATLHNKVSFTALVEELGLHVPRSHIARNRKELADATRDFAQFFARPAYSRGGLDLFTNAGPLAGALELSDCEPSKQNPWLVQPFLTGEDRCTYSVAQHGRLAAHVTYVHPKTIDHAGGIVFESIDDPEAVAITRRLIEATGYHGQISLDFMRTATGLVPLECNPRATAGVALFPNDEFIKAVSDPAPRAPAVVPAGRRRKITTALLRDMLLHWRRIPSNLLAIATGGRDLYTSWDDPVPALYQLLSYAHVLRYRIAGRENKKRSALMAAYFYDICWNGGAIE